MPPLRTYRFESVLDAQTEIVIKTYGTLIDAEERLSHHVKNPGNFRLKKQ